MSVCRCKDNPFPRGSSYVLRYKKRGNLNKKTTSPQAMSCRQPASRLFAAGVDAFLGFVDLLERLLRLLAHVLTQ